MANVKDGIHAASCVRWEEALHISEALITGSAARAMITGDIKEEMRDLNVVVPHKNFNILEDFLTRTMGYSWISVSCHPSMTGVVKHFAKYVGDSHFITVGCPKRDVHVLHLILNAPSTADMVYMTTGGVTQFYPQWMQQGVAIHSRTGDLVPLDTKLG
ncbi:hypothetical protein BDR05DRAFT_950510, partial [Suillus weaverae]